MRNFAKTLSMYNVIFDPPMTSVFFSNLGRVEVNVLICLHKHSEFNEVQTSEVSS